MKRRDFCSNLRICLTVVLSIGVPDQNILGEKNNFPRILGNDCPNHGSYYSM